MRVRATDAYHKAEYTTATAPHTCRPSTIDYSNVRLTEESYMIFLESMQHGPNGKRETIHLLLVIDE